MVQPVERIDFSYPRSDLRTPDSAIAKLHGDHIVWWHNHIRHNARAKTMPLVELHLKRLYDNVPGPDTRALVPLSNVPHYGIGTIWREGRCISDTKLTRIERDVDFSPRGWSITSREQLIHDGMEHVFSDSEYPLRYKYDRGHLLNFTLEEEDEDGNKKNLLVPCIDFFVKAYARNMDVCRAITTLLYSNILSVFYDPPERDEHAWIVRPTHKARKYDSAFLGHLLYDDYTEDQVRRLNNQFVTSRPGDAVFPRVEPWFSGPARLRCYGKWINNGSTFLSLNLAGASEPVGRPVEWTTNQFDSSDGKDGGRIVMPVTVRTAEVDEFLAEESYIEPDGHAEITIVKTPPFARLGKAREIITVRNVIQTDRGRLGPRPPKPDTHANGTGFGRGKGVGKSEHVADNTPDAEVESFGFLNDVWHAFLSIKKDNPGRVTDVSWYTPPKFCSNTTPRIILFTAEGLRPDQGKALRWIYLDAEFTERRGMMVLRITVDGQAYLCLEIQRAEPDEKNKKPVGYSGVLMPCNITDPVEMEQFINRVCNATRRALGNFWDVLGLFPNETIIFRHRPHGKALVHRRRFINAFGQMKIKLV